MALIDVHELRKVYRVAQPARSRREQLWRFFRPITRDVVAVDAVSFRINAGELVGYLGPNGAGKSTTLKMLTGILVPTAGVIRVGQAVPHLDRQAYVRQIGVVFGQRSQLWWDLPTIESFELLRHVYAVPLARWQENMCTFRALLDLDSFLQTPVRQLSLGQRMRADLAAALLHDPMVLFLDEPTIGLDVVARQRIREFLGEINRERGVTIVLTTHDLGDIEQLCQRVILIDHGRVVFDDALRMLREQYGRERRLVIELDQDDPPIALLAQLPGVLHLEHDAMRLSLTFDRQTTSAAALIARVVQHLTVRDLAVEEPAIEQVLRAIYATSAAVDQRRDDR
jgi:ABC-2 type transport system ATP-binding protein